MISPVLSVLAQTVNSSHFTSMTHYHIMAVLQWIMVNLFNTCTYLQSSMLEFDKSPTPWLLQRSPNSHHLNSSSPPLELLPYSSPEAVFEDLQSVPTTSTLASSPLNGCLVISDHVSIFESSPNVQNNSLWSKCCPLNCYKKLNALEVLDVRNNFKRRSKTLQMQYILDILQTTHAEEGNGRINKLHVTLKGKPLCMKAFVSILEISMKRLRKALMLHKQGCKIVTCV